MSVTFAEARAACVARWGDCADARWWWATRWDGESAAERWVLLVKTIFGAVELHAMRGPASDKRWPLTGPDATPLPDALDAAAAWLRSYPAR